MGTQSSSCCPLLVFASIWSHVISLSNEKKHVHLYKALYLPYLIAGLIGVPLGTWLLNIIEAHTFRILLGMFLVIWCPLMLLNPQIRLIQHSGKTADASIGLVGGILGGLGGFCGSLPSAWLMLKQLPKDQQRYILRHFNFAIQMFTLAAYLYQGNLNQSHLPYMAVLILQSVFPLFWVRAYSIAFQNCTLSKLFLDYSLVQDVSCCLKS